MLIIGAKGFAREVLETIKENQTSIAFFDDLSNETSKLVFNKYPVLNSEVEVRDFFEENGAAYTLGLGNPILRKELSEKLNSWGGKLTTTLSEHCIIGKELVSIGKGCNLLATSVVSNSTTLGKGCIVYYGVKITHDCKVGDFVELSPGATLLGGVSIGDFVQIGANATILPGLSVGNNSKVGAGAVVTRDVPENCLVVGVPAKITKYFNL